MVAASVALTFSCQLALPPLPVAERHTRGVGAAIYLELCNRVASRHFVDDLSGTKTRNICRGHETPGPLTPAPLYALAARRSALIDALDRALDPADDTEARGGGHRAGAADDHPTQKFLNGLMPLHDSERTRRFTHAAARWLGELNSPAMRALIAEGSEEAWGVWHHLGADAWVGLLERLWDVLAAPEEERAGIAAALGDLVGHLLAGDLGRNVVMPADELLRAAEVFEALLATRPAEEVDRWRLALGALAGHLEAGSLGEVLREVQRDAPDWAARLSRVRQGLSPASVAEAVRGSLMWMRHADALAYDKAFDHEAAPGNAFSVNGQRQYVLHPSVPARYDAGAPLAERSLWTRLLGIMHDTYGVPMGNRRLTEVEVPGGMLPVDIAANSLFFIPDMTRMFLEALAGQATLDLCVKRDFRLVPNKGFWDVVIFGMDELTFGGYIYDLYSMGLTDPEVIETNYINYLGLTRGRMRPVEILPDEGGHLCAARLGGAADSYAMARFQIDIEAMLRMLMIPAAEQSAEVRMSILFDLPRLGGEPFCARRADAVIALEAGDMLPALREILGVFLGPDLSAADRDRGLDWMARALAATHDLWHGDARQPPAADLEPLLAHWLPALATGATSLPSAADLEALVAEGDGAPLGQLPSPAAMVGAVARAGRALAEAPAGALERDLPQNLRALAEGDVVAVLEGSLGPAVQAGVAAVLREDTASLGAWLAPAFTGEAAQAWHRLMAWPTGRALVGDVVSRLAEVPWATWRDALEAGQAEAWPELAPRLAAWVGEDDNFGHHVWALLTDLRALDVDNFLPKLARRLAVAAEEGVAPPMSALSEGFVQVNRANPHAEGALDVHDVERLLAKVAAFLRDKNSGLDRLLDIIEHRNL